jgi:hypothetical protein
VVQPVAGNLALLEDILADPELTPVNFDISWDEVAKYIVATPEASRSTAALIDKYPDRFLVGTDNVALTDPKAVFVVFTSTNRCGTRCRRRPARRCARAILPGCLIPRQRKCAAGTKPIQRHCDTRRIAIATCYYCEASLYDAGASGM